MKKVAAIICFLLLCELFVYANVSAQTPCSGYDNCISAGDASLDKSDYDTAISCYSAAIGENPGGAAYYKRGVARQYKGDLNAAIDDYTSAIKTDEKNSDYYYSRGSAYFGLGDLDKALEDYNKSISIKPESATVRNNRGITFYRMGKFSNALVDFNAAIAVIPYSKPAGETGVLVYINRGNVYNDESKYDLAIDDYNKALEMSPTADDAIYAYYGRGVAETGLAKDDAAIADYKKAAEMDPGFGFALLALAESYVILNDPQNAKLYIDKTLSGFSGKLDKCDHDIDAMGIIKASLDTTGDFPDLKKITDKALDYFNKKDFKNAAAYYIVSSLLAPDNAMADLNIGSSLVNANEPAEAVKFLQKYLYLAPDGKYKDTAIEKIKKIDIDHPQNF